MDNMSATQKTAFCFAAATVPAVMTCAGRPWPWVLAACAAAAAVLALLRYANVPLTQLYINVWGNTLGRIVLLATALWSLLAAADAAANAPAAFPDGQTDRLACAVILALAALAGRNGAQTPARCAAVLAPLLAGVYAVILLAALPDVQLQWCRPWGTWRDGIDVAAAMLVPVSALFLPSGQKRGSRWVLAVLILAPAAAAAVTAGCISPQVAREEPMAFYTLTKTLRLLSVMERFEPLLSASLLPGFFCMVSLLTSASAQTAMHGLGLKKIPAVHTVVCLAAFGASFLTPLLEQEVWLWGSAVFWVIFPVLTLAVVSVKKPQKKQENC